MHGSELIGFLNCNNKAKENKIICKLAGNPAFKFKGKKWELKQEAASSQQQTSEQYDSFEIVSRSQTSSSTD